MALWPNSLEYFVTNKLSMSLTMNSIRIRLKIATKHTLIHGKNSRSASENVLNVMEGVTHRNFPCFRKQGKEDAEVACKVEEGTDKSLQFSTSQQRG